MEWEGIQVIICKSGTGFGLIHPLYPRFFFFFSFFSLSLSVSSSLSIEDSLEEGMATNSYVLAWRIPWTEEPGGLHSIESQRVRHN